MPKEKKNFIANLDVYMTLVSVVQMNSQDDIESNFQVIESLIQQSKAQNANFIVFPENFVCFAAGQTA